MGFGVIINENGYIVINNYVIEGVDDIEVVLIDNCIFKVMIVGIDFSIDLVLL